MYVHFFALYIFKHVDLLAEMSMVGTTMMVGSSVETSLSWNIHDWCQNMCARTSTVLKYSRTKTSREPNVHVLKYLHGREVNMPKCVCDATMSLPQSLLTKCRVPK